MKQNPDLLGLPWDEAITLLTSLQLEYQMTEINEGIRTQVDGPLRVIRQSWDQGILQILVCKVPDLI